MGFFVVVDRLIALNDAAAVLGRLAAQRGHERDPTTVVVDVNTKVVVDE